MYDSKLALLNISLTWPINLETAVGSPKSSQALGAPRQTEKCLITTKVTRLFLFHDAHQYLTDLFLRPTAVSRIHALDEIDISSRGEWSKKHALSLFEGSALSPAQTQVRQDALFHGQGRSQLDTRSVLPVRERERREEGPVCEPESGKLARTLLAGFFNNPKFVCVELSWLICYSLPSNFTWLNRVEM
ncbi:MAG: hypothetical protein VST68_04960 [Nitrospirota bacterium]|nr:hypothetical protein [Nitrospirota bacterium]